MHSLLDTSRFSCPYACPHLSRLWRDSRLASQWACGEGALVLKQRIALQKAELEKMDLSPDEVKRVLDPMRSFHLQLQEEVESYERLKRGEFEEIRNLRDLGNMLIALRIARDISQRQLAKCLGVHESQVSRDERNEYHGITLDRAARVLDALGVELRSTVQVPAEGLAGVA